MSFMSKLKSVFGTIGKAVKDALGQAVINGLTDELVTLAKKLVRDAATKELNNDQKRELVVGALVSKGFPESLSRFVVELAYQALKKELAKL